LFIATQVSSCAPVRILASLPAALCAQKPPTSAHITDVLSRNGFGGLNSLCLAAAMVKQPFACPKHPANGQQRFDGDAAKFQIKNFHPFTPRISGSNPR
jgi:hypothetical protein